MIHHEQQKKNTLFEDDHPSFNSLLLVFLLALLSLSELQKQLVCNRSKEVRLAIFTSLSFLLFTVMFGKRKRRQSAQDIDVLYFQTSFWSAA